MITPAATSHGQRRSSSEPCTARRLAQPIWAAFARAAYTRPPMRISRGVLAACLAALALASCTQVDPLEAIRKQQASGNFEGVDRAAAPAARGGPEHPETNYLYGRALAITGRNSLATFPLRKAMEDSTWLVRAGLQLAYSSLATADYNEVVDAAGRVLEQEPDNKEALLLRAKAHAQWRKDPEQALADANRVLELDPDSVVAYEPRIVALLLLDRIDEVRTSMAELERRIDEVESPESVRAWYCATRAIFTEESADIERARSIWKNCLADHPSSPEVVWKAIQFHDGLGEFEQSTAVLRAALQSEPSAQAYRSTLAARLHVAGRTAEGDELLRAATRVEDPATAAGAWRDLGKFRMSVQEFGGAAEALEHALEANEKAGPVAPELRFEYADALVLAGQLDRAKQVAESITVPAHQHMILARVAQKQGDPARALAEYDAGFRIWPDNPWTRYYAARAAEDLGNFDRAMEEYRTAIRIDPAATEARTRAAMLLLAEGKARFAAQLLRDLDNKPLEPQGRLLVLQVVGRLGTPEEVDGTWSRFVALEPDAAARGLAEAASGVSESSGGPKAAVEVLRRHAREVDLEDPRNADALRALVRFSHEAGRRETPAELTSALRARPNAAVFQEIRGLDLELRGDKAEAARAAYARAVELDPNQARALAGMGRLALASDPKGALALFDRAIAADGSDPKLGILASRALIAAGQPDPAAERLDALLGAHPFESEAAALRASIDLDRGLATDRTLDRARRAARFGGGADALDLLAKVYEKRGEAKQAEQIAQRARALREKGSSGEDQDAVPEGK